MINIDQDNYDQHTYGGRALKNTYDLDDKPVAGWPGLAHDAIRAINHLTLGATIPAPVLYDVLGNLKGVGHMLPQALKEMGDGLNRSLEEYDVYDNNRDPAESVTQARAHLDRAAAAATELGAALSAAQAAMSQQGYND